MFQRIMFPAVGFACFIGLCLTATMVVRADDPKKPRSIHIRMRDFCDQKTFDEGAGPGTCIPIITGATGMPFDFFIGELGTDKTVGEWRFNPDVIEIDEGVDLILDNLGGETHTLTKVEKFGGGFIAPLNQLSGNPVPAPECADVLPDGTLVPRPESPDNIFVEALTTEPGPTIKTGKKLLKYECCIHPWMRLIVSHKENEHNH